MKITVVCGHCRNHDSDPVLEINFKEGVVYSMCRECNRESKLELKPHAKPLPRSRRL